MKNLAQRACETIEAEVALWSDQDNPYRREMSTDEILDLCRNLFPDRVLKINPESAVQEYTWEDGSVLLIDTIGREFGVACPA